MRDLQILRPVVRRAAEVLGGLPIHPDERVLQRAVLAIAFSCRDEIANWRNHPTKNDMLKKIRRSLLALREAELCLTDAQIQEACGEVWLAAQPNKRDRKVTGQTDIQYAALDQIEKNRTTVLEKARLLTIAFEYMIGDFHLETKEGRFRAWSTNHLEPKQFTTLVSMQIFMAVRKLQRPPGPNNLDFSEFLSLIWELSCGEKDVTDWTTPIRVARGRPSRKYDDRFSARYAAQLVADDLLGDFREYVEGLRPLEIDELKPPKLVVVPR